MSLYIYCERWWDQRMDVSKEKKYAEKEIHVIRVNVLLNSTL